MIALLDETKLKYMRRKEIILYLFEFNEFNIDIPFQVSSKLP